MNQEIDKRIMELCELIAEEANPGVFVDLITALNQLLEERQKTLVRGIRLVSSQNR
jgi:hypothetical protein